MEQFPPAYTVDGHIYYRASALGMCPRALFAARMGQQPVSPPPQIQKAFDDGNTYEPIAIQQLRDKGYAITGQQREVQLPITEHISVIGHIDGLVVRPPTIPDIPLALLEIKAFAQSTLDTWYQSKLDAFPHYSWQISAYLLALQLDYALLTILNKDESDINKRLKLFKIPLPHPKADIIARIKLIEDAVAKNTPPECEPSSFFCPYPYMHESKDDPDIITDESIIKLFQQYNSAISAQEKVKKIVQDLRAKIMALDTQNARAGRFHLKISTVTTSYLDKEVLSEFLGQYDKTYSDFTKPSTYQRVTLEEK